MSYNGEMGEEVDQESKQASKPAKQATDATKNFMNQNQGSSDDGFNSSDTSSTGNADKNVDNASSGGWGSGTKDMAENATEGAGKVAEATGDVGSGMASAASAGTPEAMATKAALEAVKKLATDPEDVAEKSFSVLAVAVGIPIAVILIIIIFVMSVFQSLFPTILGNDSSRQNEPVAYQSQIYKMANHLPNYSAAISADPEITWVVSYDGQQQKDFIEDESNEGDDEETILTGRLDENDEELFGDSAYFGEEIPFYKDANLTEELGTLEVNTVIEGLEDESTDDVLAFKDFLFTPENVDLEMEMNITIDSDGLRSRGAMDQEFEVVYMDKTYAYQSSEPDPYLEFGVQDEYNIIATSLRGLLANEYTNARLDLQEEAVKARNSLDLQFSESDLAHQEYAIIRDGEIDEDYLDPTLPTFDMDKSLESVPSNNEIQSTSREDASRLIASYAVSRGNTIPDDGYYDHFDDVITAALEDDFNVTYLTKKELKTRTIETVTVETQEKENVLATANGVFTKAESEADKEEAAWKLDTVPVYIKGRQYQEDVDPPKMEVFIRVPEGEGDYTLTLGFLETLQPDTDEAADNENLTNFEEFNYIVTPDEVDIVVNQGEETFEYENYYLDVSSFGLNIDKIEYSFFMHDNEHYGAEIEHFDTLYERGGFETFLDTVKSAGSSMWSWAKGIASSAWGHVSSVGTVIIQGVQGTWENATDWFDDTKGDFMNWLGIYSDEMDISSEDEIAAFEEEQQANIVADELIRSQLYAFYSQPYYPYELMYIYDNDSYYDDYGKDEGWLKDGNRYFVIREGEPQNASEVVNGDPIVWNTVYGLVSGDDRDYSDSTFQPTTSTHLDGYENAPQPISSENADQTIRNLKLNAADPVYLTGEYIDLFLEQQNHSLAGQGNTIKENADKYGVSSSFYLGLLSQENDLTGSVEEQFKKIREEYISNGISTYGDYIDLFHETSNQVKFEYIENMYSVAVNALGVSVDATEMKASPTDNLGEEAESEEAEMVEGIISNYGADIDLRSEASVQSAQEWFAENDIAWGDSENYRRVYADVYGEGFTSNLGVEPDSIKKWLFFHAGYEQEYIRKVEPETVTVSASNPNADESESDTNIITRSKNIGEKIEDFHSSQRSILKDDENFMRDYVNTVGLSEGSYTGDGNSALVDIALAEDENVGGMKYKRWFNYQPFINSYTAWCAIFTSWVADQAGLVEGVDYPKNASVAGWREWAIQNNKFEEVGSGYIPKPGDVVIEDGNGASHVEFVRTYNPETKELTVVGGNLRDKVNTYDASHLLANGTVTGWVRMDGKGSQSGSGVTASTEDGKQPLALVTGELLRRTTGTRYETITEDGRFGVGLWDVEEDLPEMLKTLYEGDSGSFESTLSNLSRVPANPWVSSSQIQNPNKILNMAMGEDTNMPTDQDELNSLYNDFSTVLSEHFAEETYYIQNDWLASSAQEYLEFIKEQEETMDNTEELETRSYLYLSLIALYYESYGYENILKEDGILEIISEAKSSANEGKFANLYPALEEHLKNNVSKVSTYNMNGATDEDVEDFNKELEQMRRLTYLVAEHRLDNLQVTMEDVGGSSGGSYGGSQYQITNRLTSGDYHSNVGEYDLIVYIIAQEGGTTNADGIEAVTSTVFNRADQQGKTPYEILTAPYQFQGYQDGGWRNRMSQDLSLVKDAVNRHADGWRRHEYIYFYATGYFLDDGSWNTSNRKAPAGSLAPYVYSYEDIGGNIYFDPKPNFPFN